MNKVILLAGPTASGKSELAIYIAKKINGEIINADSMQVFKEIKILSARPEDYKNIKHHLYGFVSVKKSFSTGEWIKHTEKKINEILKKKKTPIIVGGTWIKTSLSEASLFASSKALSKARAFLNSSSTEISFPVVIL